MITCGHCALVAPAEGVHVHARHDLQPVHKLEANAGPAAREVAMTDKPQAYPLPPPPRKWPGVFVCPDCGKRWPNVPGEIAAMSRHVCPKHPKGGVLWT